MKEKISFFMGNEEFDYYVEEKDGKFFGKTSYDPRLNCTAQTLNEVVSIVQDRIIQLKTKGS